VVDEVFDIDVTPIMNMFVVLIPFLVSMAVFSHFAVHKFYLPPSAGSDLNNNGKVKFKTTVVVDNHYLLVTLGGELIDSISIKDNLISPSRFFQALGNAKSHSEDSLKVVVSPRDDVKIKRVVTTMDICRDFGFTSVGLSSAPEVDSVTTGGNK
jgi:biopolymer transport protein ExbD